MKKMESRIDGKIKNSIENPFMDEHSKKADLGPIDSTPTPEPEEQK